MSKIKLSPSMMCADFLNLQADLDVFIEKKIDMLHMDIMDGAYAPNFTLGYDFCKAAHAYSKIPLDYHLMVENSDRYVDLFCQIPGSTYTFHPETCRHPDRTIQHIRQLGCRPSIAIDPAMSLETVRWLLPLVDQVCMMTVNPGYAGQKLLPYCIDKMAEFAAYKDAHGLDFDMEVDGNVSWENIPKMIDAGANVLVLGTSSVFTNDGKLEQNLQKLAGMIA